mmetsp:Transcript_2664/g.8568  ORF Transcript_2664/g.8568 Transcript_2664/m.8568 type:complete len:208 (-) Transcript_2664:602-1225(-)
MPVPRCAGRPASVVPTSGQAPKRGVAAASTTVRRPGRQSAPPTLAFATTSLPQRPPAALPPRTFVSSRLRPPRPRRPPVTMASGTALRLTLIVAASRAPHASSGSTATLTTTASPTRAPALPARVTATALVTVPRPCVCPVRTACRIRARLPSTVAVPSACRALRASTAARTAWRRASIAATRPVLHTLQPASLAVPTVVLTATNKV